MCDLLSKLALVPREKVASATEAMMETETHIFIRFNAFMLYPARLWMLTRKWNSAGYVAEIEDFLTCSTNNLDSGYSINLRKDAWHGGKSFPQALHYMVAASVQNELEKIIIFSATTSLSVERKHNIDKRSEAHKVSSVARCSRDGILTAYRAKKIRMCQVRSDSHAQAKRHLHMNTVALAVQRHPEWLARPGGIINIQHGRCGRDIVHEGDARSVPDTNRVEQTLTDTNRR